MQLHHQRKDIGRPVRRQKTDELLQNALAEREQFLTARPHMRSYQREIDRILDKSGNHQGRLMVLGTMIQGKLLEIQAELCSLSRMIQYSMT